jgi:hypothetical protein
LDIVWSPLDANDQSRLQASVNATDVLPTAQHALLASKTSFYFNELSGYVNEKIPAANSRR